MAYKINRTGKNVENLLDSVDEKTIYPDASLTEDGLMTKEHVRRLEECEEDSEALTEFEILMICR